LLNKKQISILGCGWLGLPLAIHFAKNNYNVKGSTTSQNKLETLKYNNIAPFIIQLTETKVEGVISDFLHGSDTVIINIPPGLRKNPTKNHVNELKRLIRVIEKQRIKHVLYVSSTSVYRDEPHFPTITERVTPNAQSESGKQLITIEKLLKKNTNFKTTILRFSGLFDEERHPGKSLSGKHNILNPEAPVNLIHKNDCIALIFQLIEKDIWNQTFNASIPQHPLKKNYYNNYCHAHHLAAPTFNNLPSEGKIIDSSKLVQLLDYAFKTTL
jgi:nucleoside-diphosphate-sugar epimerase